MVWLIQLVELVKFGQVADQGIHLNQLIDSAGSLYSVGSASSAGALCLTGPVCLASSVGSSESVTSVGLAGSSGSFPYR